MAFQTKQGRALFAAFDPEQKERITKPNAANVTAKDKDGNPVPVDRTAAADEQLVKE